MDGWWECERLDMFFTRVLRRSGKSTPRHLKDTLRVASARLFNLQSKNAPGSSAKSITTWATICSAAC